ncbi:hypothetical protein HG530_011978 [Fusarium avenaceum]|nr:hypothetical protein HG530_011978 [Fusarium avenaceum]
MDVPIAANILGTLGALIPQIIVNYRRHNATGLQPSMMMLWAWAGVPLGVYNIVKEYNVALRIQPQILTFLSLVTWIQCYYYERKWSVYRSLLVVVPIAAVMGGIQAGLIIALRVAKSHDLDWPLILMASLSAALLAAGVLTHYWDIWTHRTVRGISFLFVAIDAAGDVFSLASVFFQHELDILGIVIYATEFVLWCGVFACGGYYNLLPWARKRFGKEAECEAQGEEHKAEKRGKHLDFYAHCTNDKSTQITHPGNIVQSEHPIRRIIVSANTKAQRKLRSGDLFDSTVLSAANLSVHEVSVSNLPRLAYAFIQGKHIVQIVLVELMPATSVDEHLACKPVLILGCSMCGMTDFELLEVLKGHFVQEPVNDHSSLDSSLRVENKDNLLLAVVEKSVLDKDVAVSDVLRGVEQSTLNQALDEIEYNSSTRDVSVSYLGLRSEQLTLRKFH